MRNLWRALALAWLGGVASPGLADEAPQPEIRIEVQQPGAGDEQVERDVGKTLLPPSDAEG